MKTRYHAARTRLFNAPSLIVLQCLACLLPACPAALVFAQTTAPTPTDALVKAIDEGKLDLNVRYRYEHVNDDGAARDANASTLRTTLGFTTGKFYNFSTRILVQDVREIGIDDFNDATGRYPGRNPYAVVADPEDTDLLEAYLAYSGLTNTTMKLGRQIITYRDNPFHRFIGTVSWRQNWQNHDAFSVVNTSLPDTTLSYAYSWNVNRIFTEEAVNRVMANFHSDSHFINLKYSGFKYGTLEAYGYLLDFDNSAVNSTATFGLRFSGGTPVTDKTRIIYALEYAMQDDYAANPAKVDEDYFLGEIGAAFTPGNTLDALTLKFNYELLSGDGVTSFGTPLATLHAYQGWADRFLATPVHGVQDIYFTAIARVFGIDFTLVYHDLSSDNLDFDYGSEVDIQATRALNKHFTLGLKYASYDAAGNLINAGGTAADVSKFWAWLQFSY
jgi:hypothetical protein